MKSALVLLTTALSFAVASPINNVEKRAAAAVSADAILLDGATYIISGAAAPKNALTLDGAQSGGDIVSSEKNSGVSQQWYAKWLGGDNEFGLISRATGEWLQVPSGDNGTQLKVKAVKAIADDSVRWIVSDANGRYTFKSKAYPDLVMDLDRGSAQIGAKVVAWPAQHNMNQEWIVQQLTAGARTA